MNKINKDETIALQWLKEQGLGKVERFCPDPPDFVIGEDEIAVEVTRLSDKSEGKSISLLGTIEETLKEFSRDPSEPRYFLNFEYPCEEKGIPKGRVVQKELRELLQYLSDSDSSEGELSPPTMSSTLPQEGLGPRWALDCGITLDILGAGESKGPFKFLLGECTLTEKGVIEGVDYLKHIPRCIEEKIDKYNDRGGDLWQRWGDWWLLLVDHVWCVPSMMSRATVAEVWGKVKESMGPFSKVIVISCYEGQAGGLGCITFEKESYHIESTR